MDGNVPHPRLRYPRNNLMSSICNLIKPVAMEKNDVMLRPNPHSHVITRDNQTIGTVGEWNGGCEKTLSRKARNIVNINLVVAVVWMGVMC